jgi:hypothetical protein
VVRGGGGDEKMAAVRNVAVVAVVTARFLSHLQHLLIDKVQYSTPNPNPSPEASGEGGNAGSRQ